MRAPTDTTPRVSRNPRKGSPPVQKITPFLWFKDDAEEAMNHYVSIFPDSKILNVSRYGDAMPELKGQVLVMLQSEDASAHACRW